MSKISDLKNSSNTEQIATELFLLIQQKDKNISNDLYSFDDNIISKIMIVSKELASVNFSNAELTDKKKELESYYKDVSKFTEVFALLDNKIDSEIKNNSSLSESEKQDLQQEFLFSVRQKHSDLFATKQQCETTLSTVDEKLNGQGTLNKSSFLERIKSSQNNFQDNGNKLKNKSP